VHRTELPFSGRRAFFASFATIGASLFALGIFVGSVQVSYALRAAGFGFVCTAAFFMIVSCKRGLFAAVFLAVAVLTSPVVIGEQPETQLASQPRPSWAVHATVATGVYSLFVLLCSALSRTFVWTRLLSTLTSISALWWALSVVLWGALDFSLTDSATIHVTMIMLGMLVGLLTVRWSRQPSGGAWPPS
jgi:hypothetical protein